jgi:hypothetical protein
MGVARCGRGASSKQYTLAASGLGRSDRVGRQGLQIRVNLHRLVRSVAET